MLKILVDRELCEANQVCMRLAPEVFQVDDQDQLHVLIAEIPTELQAKVERAVARCPRRALALEPIVSRRP